MPCSPRTDRQTGRHKNDYCGHPFRVSGVFPSTYHQGSAQQIVPGDSTSVMSDVMASQVLSGSLELHYDRLRLISSLTCHSSFLLISPGLRTCWIVTASPTCLFMVSPVASDFHLKVSYIPSIQCTWNGLSLLFFTIPLQCSLPLVNAFLD